MMERDAERLYRTAAAPTTDAETRPLFRDLAAAAAGHTNTAATPMPQPLHAVAHHPAARPHLLHVSHAPPSPPSL